ncbi:MAG: hypothetical protein N2652_11715 [Kiritimatiellae bacterium]|nr:hypothetical protein [Kiritimatiellia bacterium]
MTDYFEQAEQTIAQVIEELNRLKSAAALLEGSRQTAEKVVDTGAKIVAGTHQLLQHLHAAVQGLNELASKIAEERAVLTSNIQKTLKTHAAAMSETRNVIEPLAVLTNLPGEVQALQQQIDSGIQGLSSSIENLRQHGTALAHKLGQRVKIAIIVSGAATLLALLSWIAALK